MNLQGKHIQLRAVEPEDISELYSWENNPDHWQVSNTLIPFSRHVLEQYVHSEHDLTVQKQLRLMMVSHESKKTIGCLDLFEYEPMHQRAGLGILIADQSERRKGLASEALELVINYAWEILQLQQLFCNISDQNTPSLALFEKHGFIRTGTKKQWRRQGTNWEDEHFYQLINR